MPPPPAIGEFWRKSYFIYYSEKKPLATILFYKLNSFSSLIIVSIVGAQNILLWNLHIVIVLHSSSIATEMLCFLSVPQLLVSSAYVIIISFTLESGRTLHSVDSLWFYLVFYYCVTWFIKLLFNRHTYCKHSKI